MITYISRHGPCLSKYTTHNRRTYYVDQQRSTAFCGATPQTVAVHVLEGDKQGFNSLGTWAVVMPPAYHAPYAKTLKRKQRLYNTAAFPPPISHFKLDIYLTQTKSYPARTSYPHLLTPTTLYNNKQSTWVSCGLNTLAVVTPVSTSSLAF